MIDRETLEKYVQEMTDSRFDVVFLCGNDGKIVKASASAEKILGFNQETLVGKSFLDLFDSFQRTKAESILKKALGGEETRDQILKFSPNGQRAALMSCSTLSLKDNQGKVSGFLSIGKDLEKRVSLTKELLFKKEGLFSARRSSLTKALFEMNEKLEEKTRELTALIEVGRQVVSSLELEETLNLIVDTVISLMEAKKCVLLLLDEDLSELKGRIGRGFTKKEIETITIKPGEGIAGAVVKEGKPLLVKEVGSDSRALPQYEKVFQVKSLISAPLLVRGKVIGAINAMSKANQVFDKENLDLLTLFANEAAIAIENARLFGLTRELAITDGLTSLFTHRFFQERLREEISRAKRLKSFVSLIMLDIDRFKNYNDTYGHPRGDIVLQKVAQIIKTNIREMDLAARYGGEEFVLILPAAKTPQAVLVAERLRQAVAIYPFPGKPGKPPLKLTISLGIATYPTQARTIPDLIKKADLALYQSKNLGRNKVSLAK